MPREDGDLPILVEGFAARGAHAKVVAWEDTSVAWQEFDGVLVRSTWNYLDHYAAFLHWLERVDAATRLLNPLKALRWNLHKRYLVELAYAGLAVVPTELVLRGVEPNWESLFARFGALVIKPAISAGSFGTVRVASGDVAAARAHRALHESRDLLVQPFLESILTHGEENLVCFGGAYSHAIHKGARWAGDAEQSGGRITPAPDMVVLASEVLAWVRQRGFGALTYARVDIARGLDGRPLLMELEIVEPSLFLDRAPECARALVDAVLLSVRDGG